jgi:hypothetical protein
MLLTLLVRSMGNKLSLWMLVLTLFTLLALPA